jgi:hypothetical protein
LNFFGHAVVATWADTKPTHVLGSMLPDFETMVHVSLIGIGDPGIQRGIDLHHRTDDAFHRTQAFLSLSAGALDDLSEAGVRRGTARAVAHIAAEMFLDGCLAGDAPNVQGYLAALAVEPDGMLQWQDGGHAYRKLHGRLRTWGAPTNYAEPAFVLARLRDALRGRPALAIVDEELERVAACLPPLQLWVQRESRELLDELRDALGLRD